MKKKDKKESYCADAIRKTLAYKAVFKYPVTFFQLSNNLIAKKDIKIKDLKEELQRQVKKGYVTFKNDKYSLPGVRNINWEERKEDSMTLIKRNMHVFKIIGKIPWVKMVAVTGSAAAYNASKDDDLDVFIVSAKNRVWLTRGFSSIVLLILGKFHTSREPGNQICTNLYVDEDNLSWPEDKRNVYTASEIIKMQPIIDKDNTYFKFLSANKWVGDHYSGFRGNILKEINRKKKVSSPVINLVENLARSMQVFYMKPKRTSEIIHKGFIHFNKNDNGHKIINSYHEILKKRLL